MADIVNLRRAKKARERVLAGAKAAENRIKFGRTKAEKSRDAAEAARRERDLSGHRRGA